MTVLVSLQFKVSHLNFFSASRNFLITGQDLGLVFVGTVILMAFGTLELVALGYLIGFSSLKSLTNQEFFFN